MKFNNSSSTVSNNARLRPASFFIRHKSIFLISLFLLMLLLSILIFLCMKKIIRKKKKKIQRQNAIIKKEEDTHDDPHTTLLEQNRGETISNMHITDHILITDPIVEQKITDRSPDMPRRSTISTTNPLSESSDDDDLSDLDLTNIPLRHRRLSNKDLPDPSLRQNTNHSLNGSSEHPYIAALKEQEAQAREKIINPQVSIGSDISEESCL